MASNGYIDPHVDHLEASGQQIVGVSLGDTRTMHLATKPDAETQASFDIKLPSGSVYVQKGTVRYGLDHSIPVRATWKDGSQLGGGQRMSIMLRVRCAFRTALLMLIASYNLRTARNLANGGIHVIEGSH